MIRGFDDGLLDLDSQKLTDECVSNLDTLKSAMIELLGASDYPTEQNVLDYLLSEAVQSCRLNDLEIIGFYEKASRPQLIAACVRWPKPFRPHVGVAAPKSGMTPIDQPAGPRRKPSPNVRCEAVLTRVLPTPSMALMGRRQVVRHRPLEPAFVGSNPTAPAGAPHPERPRCQVHWAWGLQRAARHE